MLNIPAVLDQNEANIITIVEIDLPGFKFLKLSLYHMSQEAKRNKNKRGNRNPIKFAN